MSQWHTSRSPVVLDDLGGLLDVRGVAVCRRGFLVSFEVLRGVDRPLAVVLDRDDVDATVPDPASATPSLFRLCNRGYIELCRDGKGK
jgi:hypothetical protein